MLKSIAAEKIRAGTTPRSSMLERDGKDEGENDLKQAFSCWFADHHGRLVTSGANLYYLGRLFFCRCLVVFLWSYIVFF